MISNTASVSIYGAVAISGSVSSFYGISLSGLIEMVSSLISIPEDRNKGFPLITNNKPLGRML